MAVILIPKAFGSFLRCAASQGDAFGRRISLCIGTSVSCCLNQACHSERNTALFCGVQSKNLVCFGTSVSCYVKCQLSTRSFDSVPKKHGTALRMTGLFGVSKSIKNLVFVFSADDRLG